MTPVYDFECDACGWADEIELSIHHDHKLNCPHCHILLRKVITPTSIHFKGRGFYTTDKG